MRLGEMLHSSSGSNAYRMHAWSVLKTHAANVHTVPTTVQNMR